MADNMFKLESQPNWGAAIFVNNKNAFQEDPYHPLVDHIPTCTVEGGGSAEGIVCPGGCLPGGGWCVADPPPMDRMTDTCKNITLPQLRCGR